MNEMQRKTLDEALETLPLVAILRGITPEEVEDVCDALVGAGFRMIEIPLNSPRPWESIERAVAHCPASVLIGAGTVLEAADTERLERLGAPLMVTPNTDPEVVRAGVDQGLAPMIGCMTPSEALAAARSGARALKLFPAARLGTGYFKDISAILPEALPVLAVGGIERRNMAEWHAVGVRGFGFGSNLYKPGRATAEIAEIAADLVAEWRRLEGGER
ncbi:2-dehydro-3-deoxy-6-phosphogalactonate aldolase [Halomonas elongata]|uniref:2-dehydro-3-deoxy-6-phosphogalactonate aldolase n=1 Tax=Halomonas elongata TaxID=2746 RepID=UPI0038D3EBC5